jgi:hypothetical protein
LLVRRIAAAVLARTQFKFGGWASCDRLTRMLQAAGAALLAGARILDYARFLVGGFRIGPLLHAVRPRQRLRLDNLYNEGRRLMWADVDMI